MKTDPLVWFLSWGVRRVGKANLLTWTLLTLLLGIQSYGLSTVVRGLSFEYLFSAVFLGLLAGWLAGRSRLPGFLSAFFVLLLGGALTFIRVGQLGDEVARSIAALNRWTVEWLAWNPLLPLPAFESFPGTVKNIWDGSIVLLTRLSNWLAGIPRGTAGYDPVPAAILWALALWSTGGWAGWIIRRGYQLLAGLLPAIALLAVSLEYSHQTAYTLVPILGLIFILHGWLRHLEREKRWQTDGVDFAEDIRLDIGGGILLMALLLTLAASLSPAFTIQKVVDLADRFRASRSAASYPSGESLGETLGLQPPKEQVAPNALASNRAAGLPRDHLLGSGPELSQQLVMRIQAVPSLDYSSQLSASGAPHYYWRSLTYDHYTGRGWSTSPTWLKTYESGQKLLGDEVAGLPNAGQIQVVQEVQIQPGATGLLHASGTLLSVNQGFEAEWRTLPDAQMPGDLYGALAPDTGQYARPITYKAVSQLAVPSPEELTEAGARYPDWVKDRYLALPDTLPDRVLSLARDLTATGRTPYDRVLAIQAYLRTYPYSLEISPPPAGRDVVEYFLFDLKTGYCDYYASAMVVLTRAAGIPARLVVGYARGQWLPDSGTYLVTEADAHSWPEVYFPNYGWVEFEPTAARPIIERGPEAAVPKEPAVPPSPSPGNSILLQDPRILTLLVGLGLALVGSWVGLFFAWWLGELWQLRLQTPNKAVKTIYTRLHRQGQELVPALSPGHTPSEFASQLASQLHLPSNRLVSNQWAAEADQEVTRIADLYTKATYSSHPPLQEQQDQALRAWRRLRWWLLLSRLLRRVHRSSE